MFSTVDHALRFAYQMHEVDIVHLSSINNKYHAPYPDAHHKATNDLLEGLSPQERTMQAECILRVVDELPREIDREFVKAMYGRRFDGESLGKLTDLVFHSLGSDARRMRGVRCLILTYFGVKITHHDIREAFQCGNSKTAGMKEMVYDVLDEINDRCHAELNLILRDKKLVS